MDIKKKAIELLSSGSNLEEAHSLLTDYGKSVSYRTLERYAREEGLEWTNERRRMTKDSGTLETLIRRYFAKTKCVDSTAKKFGVGAWRVRQYTAYERRLLQYKDSAKRCFASTYTNSNQTVGIKS